MTKEIANQFFEGERPLFGLHDANIKNTTFGQGESPLKESQNINIESTIFKWKYPLWYSKHITMKDSVFETVAHAGVWYTHDLLFENCAIQAGKNFRRCSDITLRHVHMSSAKETLWTCDNVVLDHVQASGQYFGMNSSNLKINNLNLIGNYAFDGAKNIEVHDSMLVTKDAFWNCENVTIYNSTINGEYFGWNSKNITLINCTVESDQGFCYMDNIKLKNCNLLRTDLAFEYCSNIDASINSDIMSVKNSISGTIKAKSIGKIILEKDKIDPSKTTIITEDKSI